METPAKKQGCAGGCLSVAFWGIIALCAMVIISLVVGGIQTAGRAAGLWPTLTPTLTLTVTLAPTVTRVPSIMPTLQKSGLLAGAKATVGSLVDSTKATTDAILSATPTNTPLPSAAPTITPASLPTATSLSTNTPLPPTVTPLPTATPLPSSTPTPTATLDPTIPRTDSESRIACNISAHFVEQRIKSPSTAKFPTAFDYINGDGCKALFNNGVWTISSWVDSQNGFGAMIRTHYVAQLTYTEDDETWHLKDLVFVD